MNKENAENNNAIYTVETEFKNIKSIKDFVKDLILNTHIETSAKSCYNKPII